MRHLQFTISAVLPPRLISIRKILPYYVYKYLLETLRYILKEIAPSNETELKEKKCDW